MCLNGPLRAVPLNGSPMVRSLEDRFWSKVLIVNDSHSCWTWLGGKSNGYGRLGVKQDDKWKTRIASRIMWFLTKGVWPSKFILHTCDNPLCVRPTHLFEGSQADNMRDCSNKGRAAGRYSGRSECKLGHPLSGSNLYLWNGHKHCRICKRRRKQLVK